MLRWFFFDFDNVFLLDAEDRFFRTVHHSDQILDCVVDDVFDLQLVLVIRMRVGQRAELLRQVETVRHVLGRHKVFSHFDAVVQISHLVRCACWHEYGVA